MNFMIMDINRNALRKNPDKSIAEQGRSDDAALG